MHRKIIEYNNFFYFVPNCGNEIDIFNRLTKEQTFVRIPEKYLQNGQYFVAEAIREDDNIWVFPVYAQQPVIVYNINKKEFLNEENLTSKLKSFDGVVFTYESVCKGKDCFLMAILQSNCVISFDWKTKDVKEYRLNMNNLYSINYSGTEIWLGTWDSESIAIWNRETGELKKMVAGFDRIHADSFFKPMVTEDSVYILLDSDRKSATLFKENDKNIIHICLDDKNNIDDRVLSMYECVYNNRLFVFPYKMRYLVSIDLASKDVKADEFKISEPFVLEDYYKEYKIPFLKQELNKGILFETHELSLEELEIIVDINRRKNRENNYGGAGKKVWNVINSIRV